MGDASMRVEIESFNLADLDVSAMEVRLELTSIFAGCPHVCTENTCPGHGCGANCTSACASKCGTNCTSNTCLTLHGCQIFN